MRWLTRLGPLVERFGIKDPADHYVLIKERSNEEDDDRSGVSHDVVLHDADGLGTAVRRQGARRAGEGAEGR
jgi:hypothetical protein